MREGTAVALKNLGALDAYAEVSECLKTLARTHRAKGQMSTQYLQALQDVVTEVSKLLAARRKEKTMTIRLAPTATRSC